MRFSNTTGILPKKKTLWLTGVEVEQETSAPPPKKNPESAPVEPGNFPVWTPKKQISSKGLGAGGGAVIYIEYFRIP